MIYVWAHRLTSGALKVSNKYHLFFSFSLFQFGGDKTYSFRLWVYFPNSTLTCTFWAYPLPSWTPSWMSDNHPQFKMLKPPNLLSLSLLCPQENNSLLVSVLIISVMGADAPPFWLWPHILTLSAHSSSPVHPISKSTGSIHKLSAL